MLVNSIYIIQNWKTHITPKPDIRLPSNKTYSDKKRKLVKNKKKMEEKNETIRYEVLSRKYEWEYHKIISNYFWDTYNVTMTVLSDTYLS